jgi:hypothetical protein
VKADQYLAGCLNDLLALAVAIVLALVRTWAGRLIVTGGRTANDTAFPAGGRARPRS